MGFSQEGCAWAASETGAAREQVRSCGNSAARSNSRSAGHTRESRTFWAALFLARRYREEPPECHFCPCVQMMASPLPESGLDAHRVERIRPTGL